MSSPCVSLGEAQDADQIAGVSDAVKRKRERDRRNQHKKRQRHRNYVTMLEERITNLESQLDEAIGLNQTGPCSCEGSSQRGRANFSRPNGLAVHDDLATMEHYINPVGTPSPSFPHTSTDSTEGIHILASTFDALLATPEWLRLPVYTTVRSHKPTFLFRGDSFISLINELQNNSESMALCTKTPKPLDLMVGGSKNLLANFLAISNTANVSQLPEKFAYAWLAYIYTRWLVMPCPESFSGLPLNLRPTSIQFVTQHPFAVAIVLWPRLRNNLVRNWHKYDLDEVFGLLLCTCRIRDDFTGKFVQRENEGELEVNEAFLQQITSGDGWYLLERFWIQYPELVQGMDHNIMIREPNY